MVYGFPEYSHQFAVWAAAAVALGILALAPGCGGRDAGTARASKAPAETHAPAQVGDSATPDGSPRGVGITVPAGVPVYGAPPSGGYLDKEASPFSDGRIFSGASPFNMPFPAASALHPDSDRLIAALVANGLV